MVLFLELSERFYVDIPVPDFTQLCVLTSHHCKPHIRVMASPASKTKNPCVTQSDNNAVVKEEVSVKISASNMLAVMNQRNGTGIYNWHHPGKG